MRAETELAENRDQNVTRLAASVHAAQAQGLLQNSEVTGLILAGISRALAATVEGNATDPDASFALQSDAYWDRFEMDIKEALLGAFTWVDPTLYAAVRETIEEAFRALKKTYRLV